MSAQANTSRSYAKLTPGDPAPWFHQRATSNPNYAFDTAAGRYIVLCFFASAGDAVGRAAIESVLANRKQFDDERCCFFGVSLDARDEAEGRVRESLPGIRFFWDADGTVSRLYGAVPKDAKPGDSAVPARRFWMVLDPTLRVLRVVPFAANNSGADSLFHYLEQLPPPERFAGIEIQAPILFLPNVFEPEFCRELIRLHDEHGGKESGFMRDVEGKTVEVHDYGRKRRSDYNIEDPELIRQTQTRVLRRIRPEILKVYSFNATRMERYIVGCYSAEDGGHFRAHRDNTTKGTAHRRFAVSINLNAEFEGGEVSFPEYGPRSFKPPPGGAVVFPCALLHAVSPVTHGRRYAFLPFLYDEEAAKIREANSQFLAEGGGLYKANQQASEAAGTGSAAAPRASHGEANAATGASPRRPPRTIN
jgi:peroxiredoxin/predicted 2-oxoglutarate/Fe(II)-dependent dioxygenase YbiX